MYIKKFEHFSALTIHFPVYIVYVNNNFNKILHIKTFLLRTKAHVYIYVYSINRNLY